MLTREQIRAIYAAGPEAVIELAESLMAQITQLTARVEKLEGQLALSSKNSSKPPSSDPDRPAPKSLRGKGEGKAGGQAGHPGHRLQMVEPADELIVHQASVCSHCGADLVTVAQRLWQRRQVIDLPPIRPRVVEHWSQACTCPACGRENRGEFPCSVSASIGYGPRLSALALYLNQYQLLPYQRTAQLMDDVLGIGLSSGTLASMVQRASKALEAAVEAIRRQLRDQSVVHFDETGFHVEARRQWLHVACTQAWTYYMHHRKRGAGAIEAMNILPVFTGTAIHDGHNPYWAYEQCTHGLCNVHHLRSLTFVEERYEQSWARRMKQLLLLIKRAVARCKAAGQKHLDIGLQQRFLRLYRQLVTRGLCEHPRKKRDVDKRRGPVKQDKARNLLLYLKRHEAAVLRFMRDFEVPFDNNLAERDIRMMKVKQKISGTFRSEAGAEAFCRVRSYLSTMRKQGHDVMQALTAVFEDHHCLPAWATE